MSFKTDSSALAVTTYVDNIFSTGSDAEDAVAILQDCECHLESTVDVALPAHKQLIGLTLMVILSMLWVIF